MAASLDEARNELIILFRDAWRAQAAELGVAVNPNIVVGYFDPDGVPNEGANRSGSAWARLTIRHGETNRPLGSRRVTRNGVLVLQTFHYRRTTDVDAICQRLADQVAKAVDRHRGEVSLFGVSPLEQPPNNGYAQTDVNARFQYTTFLPRA